MTCPYQKIDRLGSGSFYTVYRVANAQGQEFALKATKNPTELDTLSRLQHPNIVRALDIIYDPDENCDYLTESLAYTMQIGGTNLYNYMKTATEEQKKLALYQTMLAYRFLSQAGVAHNDFNLGNMILVDDRWVLIDFQTCTKYYDGQETFEYRSIPESFSIHLDIDETYINLLDQKKGIDKFLASEFFDGLFDSNDLELGFVNTVELPFMDSTDETIAQKIHLLIRGNSVESYCLIFDLCYRFLASTGELTDVDVMAINLIVFDFYRDNYRRNYYSPPKIRFDLTKYLQVFNYILYRPNIFTYARSKDALLVLGELLKTPYAYSRANLKILADDINSRYRSGFFSVKPEFTDLWFPTAQEQ